MDKHEPTNVLAAFEMLLEEVENEIEFVNRAGARAFGQGDYGEVDAMRGLAAESEPAVDEDTAAYPACAGGHGRRGANGRRARDGRTRHEGPIACGGQRAGTVQSQHAALVQHRAVGAQCTGQGRADAVRFTQWGVEISEEGRRYVADAAAG